MPFLRVKEIRKMSAEDRSKKLEELKTELSKLHSLNKAGGAVDNPSRIREIRRAIARIMTVQNENKVEVRDQR
ncbi:MAG: 50S ribosomal protein L29 [Candidatus Bathyarchaeota archaeon]|nr:MAG: 50S ribosomal protein L29 [Candidatus Bathyarchaeota archaeon]